MLNFQKKFISMNAFRILLFYSLIFSSAILSAQEKFVEVIVEDTIHLTTETYTVLLVWEYFEDESYSNPLTSKITITNFVEDLNVKSKEHSYDRLISDGDSDGYMELLIADQTQYESLKQFASTYGNVFMHVIQRTPVEDEDYKESLLRRALTMGKTRAEFIANETDKSIGTILNITEVERHSLGERASLSLDFLAFDAFRSSDRNTSIDPGDHLVEYIKLRIQYELLD